MAAASPTQTVGADRIRPQLTKLSGWMNGKSVWLLPLGFPRGEAGFFGNRHFGTDCKKRLMRGSERLVDECSWMSGICSRLHHSTYCCGDFKRSPPLISLFCQSVPKCRLPKNPASPPGKPRTQKPLVITIQRASQLRGFRVAKLAAPTGCSGNHWLATTNRVHSLSQPARADSSLREGAKAALPQREAKPPLL